MSSLNFVTAVKSASITIGSSSVASVRHASKFSPRSRMTSHSDTRKSTESGRPLPTPTRNDDAARKRSQKRRDKVMELVHTEEGYVADLKALSNVHVA